MTKSITPKSSSNDEALLQTNTVPVDWPPPDTKRWVPRRKAVIVNAVHSGAMSLEEVCRCYELSVEESPGRAQLKPTASRVRVTRLQIYRDAPPARAGAAAVSAEQMNYG
jgi:Protein of unknown function (DUF1153)